MFVLCINNLLWPKSCCVIIQIEDHWSPNMGSSYSKSAVEQKRRSKQMEYQIKWQKDCDVFFKELDEVLESNIRIKNHRFQLWPTAKIYVSESSDPRKTYWKTQFQILEEKYSKQNVGFVLDNCGIHINSDRIYINNMGKLSLTWNFLNGQSLPLYAEIDD